MESYNIEGKLETLNVEAKPARLEIEGPVLHIVEEGGDFWEVLISSISSLHMAKEPHSEGSHFFEITAGGRDFFGFGSPQDFYPLRQAWKRAHSPAGGANPEIETR